MEDLWGPDGPEAQAGQERSKLEGLPACLVAGSSAGVCLAQLTSTDWRWHQGTSLSRGWVCPSLALNLLFTKPA